MHYVKTLITLLLLFVVGMVYATEEAAEKVAPEGCISLITNGNLAGDDVSNYIMKEGDDAEIMGATIQAGIGKDSSRGLVVKSPDRTNNEGAVDWNTMFWIFLSEPLPEGTKLHVEFDYRASQETLARTQAHGAPGEYHTYNIMGDIHFTTEWQTFSKDIVVTEEMAIGAGMNAVGMQSLAFVIGVELSYTEYYFDNFGVWYEIPEGDGPVKIAPNGWRNLIKNGNLASNDVSSYFMKEGDNTEVKPAAIVRGAGKFGSKGIKVKSPNRTWAETTSDWDTEFWIYLSEPLPEGSKLHVEFDYRASQATQVHTQANGAPREYHTWEFLGDIHFTTEWQTFSKDIVITEAMAIGAAMNAVGLQSIEFQLGVERSYTEFYFDNFGVWVEIPEEDEPEKMAPDGWRSIIKNGNLASNDVSSYFMKEGDNTEVKPAAIVLGAGKYGSKGIKVKSPNRTWEENTKDWDTEFWICLNEPLREGKTLHVEFDYRASQEALVYTQANGAPRDYHTWECLGSINFTTEWQTFSKDIVITKEMAIGAAMDTLGMQSIEFQLGMERSYTEYYFDNFGVWIKDPTQVSNWTDIVVNGDMENGDPQCFYVTEEATTDLYYANFTEGIGMNGSTGIKVQTKDNPLNEWDAEFFIRVPYKLPAGTPYRLRLDYKADQPSLIISQVHYEPTFYLFYDMFGHLEATTEWQTAVIEGKITQEQIPEGSDGYMQTVALNLSTNPTATCYYFDNVKFEVPTYLLDELEYNPANMPIVFADSNVKNLCLARWDRNRDNELSMSEAASVRDITGVFSKRMEAVIPIETFDEFKYFTGVDSIGLYSFTNCNELKYITLPKSLTTIGDGAFEECDKLITVNIPNSVTTIGEGAFQYCRNLSDISLPNTVTSIGGSAFCGCQSMKTFTLPDQITRIEDGTFSGCRFSSVYIPRNVSYIGERAFSGCINLTSVTIPNSVTYIGSGAFIGCSSLESAYIPNTINVITRETFMFCSKLSSINIPSSVWTIETDAFSSCTSLTSVTLPSSLREMGGGVFSDCTALREVHSLITEPFPTRGVFLNMDENDHVSFTTATLYVPAGTKEKYLAIDEWKKFGDNIVEVGMDLTPMDKDERVSYGEYGNISAVTNLKGTIIDKVYYNIGANDGWYDSADQCLVVSHPVNDEVVEEIVDMDLFSDEVLWNYTGMVIEIPEGIGNLAIDAKTTGGMMLNVKIGDAEPMAMELVRKQEAVFPYVASAPTYAYIYASLPSAAARSLDITNEYASVRIYGIAVERTSDTTTDISDTERMNDSRNATPVVVYDLNGRRLNTLTKGLNIVRMNDGRVKKVKK